MILHVVHMTIAGYERSDPGTSDVVGVFTDEDIAKKLKMTLGYASGVSKIELDFLAPGHLANMKELGLI